MLVVSPFRLLVPFTVLVLWFGGPQALRLAAHLRTTTPSTVAVVEAVCKQFQAQHSTHQALPDLPPAVPAVCAGPPRARPPAEEAGLVAGHPAALGAA